MDTTIKFQVAVKLQFVNAYRELGRVPIELVADYATVRWMGQGHTYDTATALANLFVLEHASWLQACTLDGLLDKLSTLVDAYISLKEQGLYDDF